MVKSFKLIKEYPGSPKLGTVVNTLNEEGYTIVKVGHTIYPNQHPEFWEEVETHDIVYRLGEDISHVVRIKDKVTFAIGDWVEHPMLGRFPIIGFSANKENNSAVYVRLANALVRLSTIKHVQFAFTAVDGVNLFEGDTYYLVGRGGKPIDFTNVAIKECRVVFGTGQLHEASCVHNGFHYWAKFGKRKNAEEFIRVNKPTFSIKDLEKYLTPGEIFELTNSKK